MCGICGFTGKKNDSFLKKMADSIFHRGPDEDGFFADGRVNFGMRRLSIIDVKTGHQPIHNENEKIWVVFNGEIYNFRALRKELELKGHKFYTDHSDGEVIVHLYEEYGDNFPQKMNGMFAIALWDQDKEKLLLIRDRMGVKPLFFAKIAGELVFASEIKAILLHPNYSKTINYEGIYHYFTLKNVPAPLTAFKDIFELRPGERLVFSKGDFVKERWWKIQFSENRSYDEQYVKNRILTLLEDATKLRMISDVPFGAYLSGGVDSSAVVGLMTRFSNKPVKTFSLGYEDDLKNKEADIFHARRVARKFGTDHHEYIMSSKEIEKEIGSVIESFDQPFSGTISTYFLTKLIKKHVKVALSGDAADELFGSYLSHRTAYPIHQFARLYEKVKTNSLTNQEEASFAPCDKTFLENLYMKSGGCESKWRYFLGLFTDEEKAELLSEEFKEGVGQTSSCRLFEKEFSELTATDPLNRILEMEWNTQLPDQVLAFVDFLSMAHSVEIRSPFLDYRLVEFAATIPGEMKIRNGVVKYILKKAVEDILPEGITQRPKEGFVLPVFNWMESSLKNYCASVLSPKRLARHGLINVQAANSVLSDFVAGDKSNAGKVWNLMMLQIWWERYFG